jgi:hypothetical protein
VRGLWSELHEDTLLDSTRLLSHILYVALHVSENLPPSLRRSSSFSEGTTAINVEEWMTSLHRVTERRVVLSNPQTPCSDIDATLLDAENHDPSLLEYSFKLLRGGQALNNPISVLVKDKDLEEQLSLFQIRETRWITGDNGEELEYVVCTGLPPDAVSRITQEFLVPQSMITTHSNVDITFFIDVDGEVMTTVKSLVPKILAIVHLQMHNAENRGENTSSAVEYRISTDCLTHTIHPVTLLNTPRKPYESLDAANDPLVCESTRQLPELSPSTTDVAHRSQSLEAEQHTSQPPRPASRSDVKKETPADHEPSSSKVPSSPASSVSSSAFWWGANRSGSYRSSN